MLRIFIWPCTMGASMLINVFHFKSDKIFVLLYSSHISLMYMEGDRENDQDHLNTHHLGTLYTVTDCCQAVRLNHQS